MDNYIKVDLRTVSFDVPPQEVRNCFNIFINIIFASRRNFAQYRFDCVLYLTYSVLNCHLRSQQGRLHAEYYK